MLLIKSDRLLESIMAELQACTWPGNVRELRMVLSTLWGLFPEAAKARKLSIDHLRAVLYLEGQSTTVRNALPTVEDPFILHRAECLRHLKQVDEVVRAVQVTVAPVLQQEGTDLTEGSLMQAALGLRLGELDRLCRQPLLFHSEQVFTSVSRLIWKRRGCGSGGIKRKSWGVRSTARPSCAPSAPRKCCC